MIVNVQGWKPSWAMYFAVLNHNRPQIKLGYPRNLKRCHIGIAINLLSPVDDECPIS